MSSSTLRNNTNTSPRDVLTRPVFIRQILKYALPRNPRPFFDDASPMVLAKNILTKISVFYQVCSSWKETIIYFSSGVLSPLLLPKTRLHFLRVFYEVCEAFNKFFVRFLAAFVNQNTRKNNANIQSHVQKNNGNDDDDDDVDDTFGNDVGDCHAPKNSFKRAVGICSLSIFHPNSAASNINNTRFTLENSNCSVDFNDFESAIKSSPRYFAFHHFLIEHLLFKEWTVQRRQNATALNKFLPVHDSKYPFCTVLQNAASAGNFLLIKVLIEDLKIDIDFNADALPVGFHEWQKLSGSSDAAASGKIPGYFKHRSSSLKFAIEMFRVSKYFSIVFTNLAPSSEARDRLLMSPHHFPFLEHSSLECVRIIAAAMLRYQSRRANNYRKRRMSFIYKGTTHKDREKHFQDDPQLLFDEDRCNFLWRNEKWRWVKSGNKNVHTMKRGSNLFDEPDLLWEKRNPTEKGTNSPLMSFPIVGVSPFAVACHSSRIRDVSDVANANAAVSVTTVRNVNQIRIARFMVNTLGCQIDVHDTMMWGLIERSYNSELLQLALSTELESLRKNDENNNNEKISLEVLLYPFMRSNISKNGYFNPLRSCFLFSHLITDVCSKTTVNVFFSKYDSIVEATAQEDRLKLCCVNFVRTFLEFAEATFGDQIRDLMLFDFFFMPTLSDEVEGRSIETFDWNRDFVVAASAAGNDLSRVDPIPDILFAKSRKKYTRQFSLVRLLILITSNNELLVEFVFTQLLAKSKNQVLVRTVEKYIRSHAFDLVERCFELRMPSVLSVLDDKVFSGLLSGNSSMSDLRQTLLVSPVSKENCMALFGIAVTNSFNFPPELRHEPHHRNRTLISDAADQNRRQDEIIDLLKFLVLGLKLKIEEFSNNGDNVVMVLAKSFRNQNLCDRVFHYLFSLRRIDLKQRDAMGKDFSLLVSQTGKQWILGIAKQYEL